MYSYIGVNKAMATPLAKLRVTMALSITAIIALGTLILTAILTYLYGYSTNILPLSLGVVVGFNIFQWLVSPYIIEAVYKVRPIRAGEPYGWLIEVVERVARRSGLKKTPRVGIAEINIPNAFAYESPLTGPRIAVTRALLEIAPPEEIEAVIAHEVGHIKHRDVVVMMVISIIPAIMYWLGQVMYRAGLFGTVIYGGDRDRRQSSLGGAVVMVLIGLVLIVISFIFNLVVLFISRLREYYADSNAVLNVRNGDVYLKRALTRIMLFSGSISRRYVERHTQLKALFIADPEVAPRYYKIRSLSPAELDQIAEEIKRSYNIPDIFSTHPSPAKRFRYIEELARSMQVRYYTP